MSQTELLNIGPFSKEGPMSPSIIQVTTVSGDVRRVQVSFWVNQEEYFITSNEVECSVKGAQLAVELLTLLFGPDPRRDNSPR